MNISGWNVSAASNNAAPPDGAPEGWLASQVNDVVRECMAAVARWYQDSNGKLVTGGAGNAYTLTTNSSFQAFSDLSPIAFRLDRANTGAATLNIDGLGAKSMRVNGRALVSGQLIADTIVIAIYNSEDDAFDVYGLPANAADLVGTLADARLSSNVPLKDSQNVFTNSGAGGAIVLSAAAPVLKWIETDQDTDEQRWRLHPNNGRLQFSALSDDEGTSNVFLQATRTGASVSELALAATSIKANSNEVLTQGVINGLTAIDVSGLAATDGIYVDDNGTAKRMAFQDMGIRVVNAGAGDQTFALNDANTLQTIGNTNRTFTIPPNSSVAFNIGTCIYLASTGSGAITVDPGAGVTLNSVIAQGSTANRTVLAGGTAVLIKVGTNAWNLVGDIN